MPRLGPSGGGPGAGGSEAIPAGEYIIALRSFKRAVSKAGNEYLRCRWVVCAGPLEGKAFWTNMALNVSVEGTANRWRILMEACGVSEEFELGSREEGTQEEGDQNIRELFRNKPFKVTVKREKNGAYENNDIEMIHYVRTWTDSDKAAMDHWLDALDNAGQPGGAGGGGGGRGSGGRGSGYQDDDAPVGGGQARGNDWADTGDYGPPGAGTKAGGFAGGDDDIPF